MVHPTFSNFSFNSSASLFPTFYLSTVGTFSTISLASFNPNPITVLTSLIILILEAASNLDNSKLK